MKFNTIGEFYLWLKKYEMCILDSGSQGCCYKIENKVYKIFNQFIDEFEDYFIEYDKDQILMFSSILNNTYVFPNDIITVGDMVVGYITEYVNGETLDKIDPLVVNLDVFGRKLERVYSDIEIISDNGVCTYDVIYNIMYGKDGFKIVDTMEYSKSREDTSELFRINKKNFNIGIQLFLIDGYFDDFINSSIFLSSIYNDPDIDINIFLREFRKALSLKEGNNVSCLGETKKCLTLKKKEDCKFIRDIYF